MNFLLLCEYTTGCGDIPDIEDGSIVPFGESTFGSEANVICEPGFVAEKPNITCLTSGVWDNVTCVRTGILHTIYYLYMFKEYKQKKNNKQKKLKGGVCVLGDACWVHTKPGEKHFPQKDANACFLM